MSTAASRNDSAVQLFGGKLATMVTSKLITKAESEQLLQDYIHRRVDDVFVEKKTKEICIRRGDKTEAMRAVISEAQQAITTTEEPPSDEQWPMVPHNTKQRPLRPTREGGPVPKRDQFVFDKNKILFACLAAFFARPDNRRRSYDDETGEIVGPFILPEDGTKPSAVKVLQLKRLFERLMRTKSKIDTFLEENPELI